MSTRTLRATAILWWIAFAFGQNGSPCLSDEWACSNGECIYYQYECDNVVDCSDGSDEDSCEDSPRSCESDEWACDNGECINDSFRCDDYEDCSDRSDEKNCREDLLPIDSASLFDDPVCSNAIEVTPFSVNSLVFGVEFSSNSANSNVHVEYEPSDHSRQRLRSLQSDSNSDSHTLHMYRLYEDTQYQFFIYENGQCVGKGFFKTGFVPEKIVGRRGRNPVRLNGTCSDDYFIIGIITDIGNWYGYDTEGNLVWWNEETGIPLHGAFVVKDDHNIIRHHEPEPEGEAGSILLEFTPHQQEVNEFSVDCEVLHHGLDYEDGWIWSVGKARHSKDLFDTEEEVLKSDLASDTIVRIKDDGSVAERVFDLIDFVDPVNERTDNFGFLMTASEMFVCEPEANRDRVEDWIHINGISVLDDEMLLSSRNLDTLYNFKLSDSKDINSPWELNYRLGPHQNYSDFDFEHPEDHFYSIHGPELLHGGNIAVFDNGVVRPDAEGGPYSRGLELQFDHDAQMVRKVFEFSLTLEDGTRCISTNRGKVQHLKNGNVMILFPSCEPTPNMHDQRGFIVEVNRDEEMVCLFAEEPKGKFLVDFEAVYSIGGETVVDSPNYQPPTSVQSQLVDEDEDSDEDDSTLPLDSDRAHVDTDVDNCSSNEWRCSNGDCIRDTWECDDRDDCDDGSDEDSHCDSGTPESSSASVVSSPSVAVPPATMTNQHDCLASEWTCIDGACVPASFRCDNIVDCDDGSDEDEKMCDDSQSVSRQESSASQEPIACTGAQWACSDGSECISGSWECDGTTDCSDGSDEDEHCKGSDEDQETSQPISDSSSPPVSPSQPAPQPPTDRPTQPSTDEPTDEPTEIIPPPTERPTEQPTQEPVQEIESSTGSSEDTETVEPSPTRSPSPPAPVIISPSPLTPVVLSPSPSVFSVGPSVLVDLDSSINIASEDDEGCGIVRDTRALGRTIDRVQANNEDDCCVHCSDIRDCLGWTFDGRFCELLEEIRSTSFGRGFSHGQKGPRAVGAGNNAQSEVSETRSESSESCRDSPPNWEDRLDRDCNFYERSNNCGKEGNRDFHVGGVYADEACCACGGGTKTRNKKI